jgi:hypothetical protein
LSRDVEQQSFHCSCKQALTLHFRAAITGRRPTTRRRSAAFRLRAAQPERITATGTASTRRRTTTTTTTPPATTAKRPGADQGDQIGRVFAQFSPNGKRTVFDYQSSIYTFLGFFFPQLRLLLINYSKKKDLATFWATFSKTHLVTLVLILQSRVKAPAL